MNCIIAYNISASHLITSQLYSDNIMKMNKYIQHMHRNVPNFISIKGCLKNMNVYWTSKCLIESHILFESIKSIQ